MNKQEVIERLNNKLDETFAFQQSFKPLTWTHMECESKANAYMTAINYVEQLGESEKNLASTIKLLTNLEPDDFLKELKLCGLAKEPQKVKVPAFVAEWFEENKHNLSNSLWEFTAELNEKTLVTGAIYTEFESWFIEHPRAYEFITSMGKGYEVEQPKRYMVRLNNGEGYIFDITRSWTYKKLFETKNEADARAELHDGTVEEVPNEL